MTRAADVLPLLPLRDIVVFPHMIVPLFVGRPKSVHALEQAMHKKKNVLLATQKNARVNDPDPNDIHEVGTVAQILQILKLADGTVKTLVEGLDRARITAFVSGEDFFRVRVAPLWEEVSPSPELEALLRSLGASFEQYVRLNSRLPQEVGSALSNVNDPNRFADIIASHLTIKVEEKQKLLEIANPQQRLERLLAILDAEIEILQLERRVKGRVKRQMEKSQKEYYLQEQMKAIQKELGKQDDSRGEIEELKEKIKKAKMPEEVHRKALKELKRLEMMPSMSPEATVVRNYIDWLVDLPWTKRTKDVLKIETAERILEADHYGLEKIKERIIEYLAVRRLVNNMKGPILCLVGPPGVGKTSLGKSIARAMGRKFVRLSLGGVRDEAEIRGHRRTYIGALPGRIIQSMKRAGTKNPVFMLDEVDKMSTDFRGDPSSALLEVLDPEQNNSFNDHYLEVDYDLSEVMFITTANILYTIPQPLQDRMEILRLPGYTEHEKMMIAEKFLNPKKIREHGLDEKQLQFSRNALRRIIQRYTREAGVRNLEREIANVCRKVAKQVVQKGKRLQVRLTSRQVETYLGIPKYRYGRVEEVDKVGIATGLAWTEVGGELLVTESMVMDGSGKLTLTGKLGDVMQESAQAALSYVRSKAHQLSLDPKFYRKTDIHIHLPEGAIPKDGPSAGITMATALVSCLTKVPVRKDVAMTGEITLRGRVLPVGGVKEKLLAAHRGDITTVLLPKENEKDLKEIPAKVKQSLRIILVETMDEVLRLALVNGEQLFADKVPDTVPGEVLEEWKRKPAVGPEMTTH